MFRFFLSFILICFVVPAHAFRVLPMVYDLAVSGPEATKTIRVDNSDSSRLPVEVFAQKRIIHEDGSETREDAEDDFLIFPPQFSVEAGKSQAIRIQYIGAQDIKQSVGYVITVAQLPVNFKAEEEAGVKFAFEFGTSVNVIPKGAKSDVKILSVKAKANTAEIVARNNGEAYTRLIYGRWVFSNNAGEEYIIEGDLLRDTLEQPLIQPQTKRKIVLNLPKNYSTQGLRVRYEE